MIRYDPHNWIDHLFDLKGSMVKEIIGRVFLCFVWSALVVACHHFLIPVIAIPGSLHSFVGVALGLLLVFRTNSSYDRFWEGRKAWGSILNESRNLGRFSRVLFGKKDEKLFSEVLNWTIAFAYCSAHRLRGTGNKAPLFLSSQDQARLQSAFHAPLFCTVQISTFLNEAREKGLVSDFHHINLDHNVQLLVDYLGFCERIHTTPLPFAYVVHLRRALIIYCFTLPFALVESFGWLTIIACFFVAYIFFGIEEIGVEIEDPFGFDDNDLPLEIFCQNIEANLLSLK